MSGNGKRKRIGSIENWQPRKWKPIHELTVILACQGNSNKAIAQRLSITPVHVANILNSDEAEKRREIYLTEIRKKALADIPATLTRINEKTVKRMEQLLDNDEKFEAAPFAIIDRGLRIMEGQQTHLKKKPEIEINATSTNNIDNRTQVLVQGKLGDRIATALEKANVVRELYPVPIHIEERSGDNGSND